MSKKEMEQEVKKELLKKLIVEGVVVSARYGATKFDDNNKYRVAIKSDSINYDEISWPLLFLPSVPRSGRWTGFSPRSSTTSLLVQ